MHPDSTIKNLKSDNTRELVSYEADDLKAHEHDMTQDHDMTHDHDMSHQHRYRHNLASEWVEGGGGGLGARNAEDRDTWGGRDRTGGSSKARTGYSSKANTGSTGGSETRMKNTAGEWYMLLKINI